MQACADDTIDKLRLLHPQGDLDFDRQLWPSRDETRAQDRWLTRSMYAASHVCTNMLYVSAILVDAAAVAFHVRAGARSHRLDSRVEAMAV